MNHWILKTEPTTYSYADLVHDGRTDWDGVRNHQSKIHLKGMQPDDLAFIYHSGDTRAVVGLARITKASYPDPKDSAWVAVEIAPVRELKRPVPLSVLKAEPILQSAAIVRHGRLSVSPLTAEQFDIILSLADGESPVK